MDLVFHALLRSSRPANERMIFAIRAELDDEYDLCGGTEKFCEEDYPASEWGLVADQLLHQLGEQRVNPGRKEFSSKYHRDRLVGWIVTALDHVGRDREATDLCVAEVELTDSYARLVRRLIRKGSRHEAVTWIKRGIDATGKSLPGIAAELRTIQRELWEKEGDRLQVAAVRAEEFLCDSSYRTYCQLKSSSESAGVWDTVKAAVIQYLKDGTFPVLRQDGKKKSPFLFGALPPVGLTDQKSWKTTGAQFFEVLIDIAIAEHQPDEVIAWYDRFLELRHSRGLYYRPDDKVADAVFEQFPDRALGIWKEKAERLAEEARPKFYEAAVGYLKKIRALMKNQDMDDAWEEYLAKMRGVHERKKRFLEMLMILEGKKILKSR